jgi:hypothetical protein
MASWLLAASVIFRAQSGLLSVMESTAATVPGLL